MKMLRNMAILVLVCYGASVTAETAEQRWFAVFQKMGAVTDAEIGRFINAVRRKSWSASARELLQDIKDTKKALKMSEELVASLPGLADVVAEKQAFLKHNHAVGLDGLRRYFDYLNSAKGISGLESLSNATDRKLYLEIKKELGR